MPSRIIDADAGAPNSPCPSFSVFLDEPAEGIGSRIRRLEPQRRVAIHHSRRLRGLAGPDFVGAGSVLAAPQGLAQMASAFFLRGAPLVERTI